MTNLRITYRGTVYPWHCDHMGHMNVMWYTGKFDEASWVLLSQIGLTQTYLRERNCGMAALQQDITYKRELRAGDILTVRSGVLDIQDKTVRIFHEMKNEETGEVSAFAKITGVYMDSLARKARPIPLEIARRIRSTLLDQSNLYWTDTLRPIPKQVSIG
jgi:acyl-CoA thioester hydrolase